MKAIVTEAKLGMAITLEPENKEEVLKLLRYAKNAKLVKPFISFSFDTDAVMYIELPMISETQQNNRIIKS